MIKRRAALEIVTLNEELRRMLDERGVEWEAFDDFEQTTQWSTYNGAFVYWARERDGKLLVETTAPTKCSAACTPEQAIVITMGRKPLVDPTWERWHKSLKHDEIKSIGDAVKQLMYEAIEFGGDMGPNGNTYNGIDEGDVLTSGFINKWVTRFESMLDGSDATSERHGGAGTCHKLPSSGETRCFVSRNGYEKEFGYWKCSNCGVECFDGAKYCMNCGAKAVGE